MKRTDRLRCVGRVLKAKTKSGVDILLISDTIKAVCGRNMFYRTAIHSILL